MSSVRALQSLIMKRAHPPEDTRQSKRVKRGGRSEEEYAFFDDESLKRRATDILKDGTDNTGYISAKVFMTWPIIRKKACINVETFEESRKYRFDVEFSGQCADFFDRLHFDAHDQFHLSLKGARIEKKQHSSSPYSLPMVLRYTEGVLLKFSTRSRRTKEDGQVVDLWKLREAAKADDEDWFKTPRESPKASRFGPATGEPELPTVDEGIIEPQSTSTNVVSSGLSHSPSSPRLNDLTNADVVPPLIGKSPGQGKPSLPRTTEAPPSPKHSTIPKSNLTHSNDFNSSKLVQSVSEPSEPLKPQGLESRPAPITAPVTKRAPEQVPKISKSKARKLKKKLKQAQAAAEHAKDPSASTSDSHSVHGSSKAPTPVPERKPAPPSEPDIPDKASMADPQQPQPWPNPIVQPVDSTASLQPMSTTGSSSASPPSQGTPIPEGDPALMLKAGFRTLTGDFYHALESLACRGFSPLHHVIGVVTFINPPHLVERTGDWACSFVIVDPSNYKFDIYSTERDGFRINCFTKKYKEWLPSAQCGDVLIARNVKVQEYGTAVSGVGYHDKFKWAIFTPSTGKAHHGNVGDVPVSEELAPDGYGVAFSPFWEPAAMELEYCLKMADWWRAVQEKKEKEMGHVHQIGSIDDGGSWKMSRRQHRLIREAGPDVPPNGFFDCTVQVLYGYLNDNGVYSLYVTDYTKNDFLCPIQGSWCPTGLADFVLKVEMWEKAAEIGPTMIAGDYYSMKNNRIKISKGGYSEGTISDPKIYKLEEADAEHQPHLKILLERKAEWEKNTYGGSSPAFQHKLIQDVLADLFFTCTVEVLHITVNGNGTCLYVTDYTSHPELPPISTEDSWSRGLQGHIVRIWVQDGHVDTAKSLSPGCFCVIRNLRLKKSTTGREFQGRLGGHERLIHMLNPQTSDNKELKELISRKEEWKQEITNDLRDRKPSRQRSASPANSAKLYNGHNCSTIKEIQSSENVPNEFRVKARVVDFYPLHLEDCVVLYCARCEKDILKNRKACFECDDADHEFVQCSYRFFFRIEDNEGTQLTISVSNECPLLEGLEPKDFHVDQRAFHEFFKRLEPILGNLLDVHEGILHGKEVAPKTPVLEFVLDGWNIPDDGVNAFGLRNYTHA